MLMFTLGVLVGIAVPIFLIIWFLSGVFE